MMAALSLTEQAMSDGGLVIRTARKDWHCEGNGAAHPTYSAGCWHEIRRGFRYLEVLWSAPAYASGTRVCEACAREFYADWVMWQ
jgi:hypothetical protein